MPYKQLKRQLQVKQNENLREGGGRMENKKKRRIFIGLLLIVTLVVSLIGVTAYANSGTAPINPDEEQTVTDKTSEFNIDAYQSFMISERLFFKSFDTNKWINTIANVLFDLNKMVYSGFKEGVDLFGDSSIVKDHVLTFTNYSSAVFDTFYKQFGFTIIACMAIYVFYLYFAKSPQQALKQLMAFSAVMIFAFAWNANAPTFVRWFDDLSNEMQGELIRTTARLQGGTAATPVGHAQNVLFELAVEEPYLLMNYGTADKSEIVTIDNPNIISELLYTGALDPDRFEEIDAKLEEQAKTNIYLTPEMGGWKLGISFLSIFGTILLGTPILALQFFNFLMGMLALLMTSIMGFAMFLSLIPQFRHLVWKMFSKLIGFFGARVALGVAFMALMSVINVIRQVVPASSVGMYMMQILSIFVTMFAIWKYRDKLINLVSAGMITSSGIGNFGKDRSKNQKEDASEEVSPESPDASTTDRDEEKNYGYYRRFRNDHAEDGQEAFQDHMKHYDEDADATEDVSTAEEEAGEISDEMAQITDSEEATTDEYLENQDEAELEETLENNNEEQFGVTDETSEDDGETQIDEELQLLDDPEQEGADMPEEFIDEQLTMSDEPADVQEASLDSNDLVAYASEEEDEEDLWVDPILINEEDERTPEPDLRDLLPTFDESLEFPFDDPYIEMNDPDGIDRYDEQEGSEATVYDRETESDQSELSITVNGVPLENEGEPIALEVDQSLVTSVHGENDSKLDASHLVAEQQSEVAEQLDEAKGE